MSTPPPCQAFHTTFFEIFLLFSSFFSQPTPFYQLFSSFSIFAMDFRGELGGLRGPRLHLSGELSRSSKHPRLHPGVPAKSCQDFCGVDWGSCHEVTEGVRSYVVLCEPLSALRATFPRGDSEETSYWLHGKPLSPASRVLSPKGTARRLRIGSSANPFRAARQNAKFYPEGTASALGSPPGSPQKAVRIFAGWIGGAVTK